MRRAGVCHGPWQRLQTVQRVPSWRRSHPVSEMASGVQNRLIGAAAKVCHALRAASFRYPSWDAGLASSLLKDYGVQAG